MKRKKFVSGCGLLSLAIIAGNYLAIQRGCTLHLGQVSGSDFYVISKAGIEQLTPDEYNERFKTRAFYVRQISQTATSLEGFITNIESVTEFQSSRRLENVKYNYVELDESKIFLDFQRQNIPQGGRRARLEYIPMQSREINQEVFDWNFLRRYLFEEDELTKATRCEGIIQRVTYLPD